MQVSIKLFLITSLFSCASSDQKSDDILAINYIFNFPMVSGNGQVDNMLDTTTIYYYQDLILYQLPYRFSISKITSGINTDSIEQVDLISTKKYNFLVVKQGNKNGLWYKTMTSSEMKKVAVDSVLSGRGFPESFLAMLANADDTLIETVREAKDDMLIEKYIPKTKPDDPCCYDTTLVYYSKSLKDIPFSFSPKHDSLKNSKLFKFRLAYNEAYSSQYLMTMPKREIRYEILETKVVNEKAITDLFRRFRQDEKSVL